MGNDQKMNCELKGSVNMKFQDGKTVNLTEVLYIPQYVKKLLIVSRLVSKVSTRGTTQYKMIINKNGVSMILDTRKVQNKSMMFHLRGNSYAPSGQ